VLHLEEGVLEAQLAKKVRAVIEGPAIICLEDDDILRLDRGRGHFTVPPKARGFQVVTPTQRIRDLGTQFGVLADPAENAAEVHVFEGRVEVRNRDAPDAPDNLLVSGQALLFDSSGGATEMAARPQEFLTKLPETVSIELDENFETGLGDDEILAPFVLPGWTAFGDTEPGVFNPEPGIRYYNNPALLDRSASHGSLKEMKGPTMAYLWGGKSNAGITRSVDTLRKDSAYSLTIAIGHRPAREPDGVESFFGGYTISIVSGDTVLASVQSESPPGEADSVDYVHLSWDSTDLPSKVKAGDALAIRIQKNRGGLRSYLDFDHIRLIRSSR
jgi:hypothetical protein